MKLITNDLSKLEVYKLLTGAVVPRPIAWVTSINDSGLVNLAPFSAFTYLSTEPPLIGFSIGYKPGTKDQKDTERNIRQQKNFVCHIGTYQQTDLIQKSSFPYGPEVSEVSELNLVTELSDVVSTPRLKSVKVAMECQLDQIIDFGRDGSKLIVGEVVAWHIADEIFVNGKIDSFDLDPCARIAGLNYAQIANRITYEKN